MHLIRTLTRLAPLAVALLLVAACDGDRGTAPSSPPSTMLSDGSRDGGNPNFFFLPPLVPSPVTNANFSAGQFNGAWKPVVEFCEVSLSDLAAGCAGPLLRTYRDGDVTVSTVNEQYQVQVDTREAWAVGGHAYRASVFVEGKHRVRLGFIDIVLSSDKGSVKNARYDDVVPLTDGRTIPLKFRIENGATISPTAPASAEQLVTNAGAIVRTDASGGPGSFAVQFPAGWLPAPYTEVMVTVERMNVGTTNPCLTSVPNLIQTSDCWRVETFPQLPRLAQDVIVAFCPTIPATDPKYDAQTVFKFDAPTTVRELENVPTTLIDCNGTIGLGPMPHDLLGRLRHGALALARGVGELMTPKSAYAIDAGWGSKVTLTAEPDPTGAFSDFFWGVPLRVDVVSGDVQTGPAGDTLPVAATVRVTGTHLHGTAVPIPGVTVTFTPSGGGFPLSTTAVTDASGLASVNWVLGTSGAQSLQASVTSVGTNTSASFTASIAAPAATITLFHDNQVVTGTTQNVTVGFSKRLEIVTSGAPNGCTSITSSDPNVIQAVTNQITALSPGTAVVTVTCPPATATVTYVVTAATTAADTIHVTYYNGQNVVDATNTAAVFFSPFVTAPSQVTFVAQPFAGDAATGGECGFVLTNPPSAAPMNVASTNPTSVTLNVITSSPTGQPSQLAITCSGVTRTIAVSSQPIPG